jgi:hypothetical protein
VRRAALVGLFCLASASVSWAQRPVPYPIVLRITGFIGTKPEGVKDLARWVVAVEGQQYTLHVTKLEPIGVDVAYWNILNRLEPFPVTLVLEGNKELLRQFTSAPPGTQLVITGNFDVGPGPATLLLSKVEPVPATSPVP